MFAMGLTLSIDDFVRIARAPLAIAVGVVLQFVLMPLAVTVAIAVIAHNGLGLAGGYWLSRLLGFDRRTTRTISIEVGMQNLGLAVALANQFFTAAAALPGALFLIWHNVSGALLAGYWKRCPAADRDAPTATRARRLPR